MRSSFRRLAVSAGFVAGLLAGVPLHGQQYNSQLFSGMKWRLVGPGTGGRVETVAGVPSQPDTYYIGAVDGGVLENHEQRPDLDAAVQS